jgi:hypothetical protein
MLTLGGRLRRLLIENQCAFLYRSQIVGQHPVPKYVIDCTSIAVLHDAAVLTKCLLESILDHEEKLLNLRPESLLSLLVIAKKWPEEKFLKYAKYLTAWPMAHYLENKAPNMPPGWPTYDGGQRDTPDFRDTFSGGLGKYLKNRLARKDSWKNLHLWYTWLQGIKKGCAPAGEQFLSATLRGHAEALSADSKLSELDDDDAFIVSLIKLAEKFWDRSSNNNKPPLFRKTDNYPTVKVFNLGERRETICDSPEPYLIPPGQDRGDRLEDRRRLVNSRSANRVFGAAASRALGPPEIGFIAVDPDRDYEDFLSVSSDDETESTCDSESNRDQSIDGPVMARSELLPFYTEKDEMKYITEPFDDEYFDWVECACFDRDHFPMLYAPTMGASCEANYGDGGTHNWMYDWYYYGWDRRGPADGTKSKYSTAEQAKRIAFKEEETIAYHYDFKTNKIVEEKGRVLNWQFEDLIQQTKLPNWEHKNVKIIALLEPLKVRTISKGNALKYWLARPVQKEFRKHLSRFPQFALTGGPNSEDTLRWLWKTTDDLVDRVRQFCPGKDMDFTHVVSGDYSSATDKLDIRATKIVFEAFLKRIKCPARYNREVMESDWKNILRDVLYEQKLVYPKIKGQVTPEDTQQKNGQLMGSNLSFPILCVVNLMGYWMALEKYLGLTFEPKDLPVLVNGDDILFRTPKPNDDDEGNFYTIWQNIVAKLGFELSVGKNYVHHEVFTINSECWRVTAGSTEKYVFKQMKYLNIGLLTNDTKSLRDPQRHLPLGDKISQCLEGAWNKERCFRRLKHYYKVELKDWMQIGRNTTCNIFAHQLLGGLGVKTHGIDPKFTKFQQRFASFNRQKLEEARHEKQLKDLEKFLVAKEADGPSQSFEVRDRPDRRVKWVNEAEYVNIKEQEPSRLYVKDVRTLPTLSRIASGVRQAYIQRYSTRSLKKFRHALRDNQLTLDSDPTKWDKRLVYDRDQSAWGTRVDDYDCRDAQGYINDDMLATVVNMCDSY